MGSLMIVVLIAIGVLTALFLFAMLIGRLLKMSGDPMMELRKQIFLISPVRGLSPEDVIAIKNGQPAAIKNEEIRKIYSYVEKLEKEGHSVHWPIRNTNQDDSIGLRICSDNFQAADDADEIHIWWHPDSSGSKFDFGIAFALWKLFGKPIILANIDGVKPTPTKSFENVLLELHKQTRPGE